MSQYKFLKRFLETSMQIVQSSSHVHFLKSNIMIRKNISIRMMGHMPIVGQFEYLFIFPSLPPISVKF